LWKLPIRCNNPSSQNWTVIVKHAVKDNEN
jgi:hypothetical protein